jgi:hypothetical protein
MWEVHKALEDAKKATADRKTKKENIRQGRKRKVVNESEETSSQRDFYHSDVEILDWR